MDQRVTILPISPDYFWPGLALLGLLLATGLIYGVLTQTGRPQTRPIWEDIPERWRFLTILLGLLWLGLFGLAIWAAYLGLLQAIHAKPGATSAGQSSLGFGALLAALLGAPFVIWGTLLKYQTVRYQKEGHMTDRINTAIEMLGAEKTVKKPGPEKRVMNGFKADAGKEATTEETVPNIEVRIGAILSLERIAQDSTTHDRGRDHVRVMEILCAYVRENSNAREPKDSWRQIWERESKGGADGPGLTKEEFMEKHKLDPESLERMTSIEGLKAWAGTLKAPRVDVLLALQVLGRRTNEQRKAEAAWPDPPDKTTAWPFDIPCPDLPEEPDGAPTTGRAFSVFREELKGWKDQISGYKGYRLDLSGANLQGADLSARRPDGSDAVFSGANLLGVRMEGAKLLSIRIEGAYLHRSRLDGAWLYDARMDGALLWRARMEGVKLSFAHMNGADMRQSRMEGSNLQHAQMLEADLSDARIENVEAYGVEMQGASLRFARIKGARLYFARMEGADLHGAAIDNATKLPTVTFHGTAFRSIDLGGVTITQEQVNVAFADGSVTLPEGLNRPAHWPIWVLQDLEEHSFDDELRKWRNDPANYTPPPPRP
jgi:prepilin-type processing-associated H-X9-DG protein